jgi:adenosylcobinamide-GDP ribazoletransferase
LIALVIATFLIALLSLRQIDGQTGDVLGAVEQVGEIVVLLVAAV